MKEKEEKTFFFCHSVKTPKLNQAKSLEIGDNVLEFQF